MLDTNPNTSLYKPRWNLTSIWRDHKRHQRR